MKTIFAAAVALAMGTGVALADGANGNGPVAPNTPFTIWSMQSQNGKPFTPTSELMRMAHNGQGLDGVSAPHGVAQNAPAQTPSVAVAQNGQAVHTYVTQSGHGTWLFAPAQNGND